MMTLKANHKTKTITVTATRINTVVIAKLESTTGYAVKVIIK